MVQTHRFTNLKTPDPSLLRPASHSVPHLSVSLCAPMKNWKSKASQLCSVRTVPHLSHLHLSSFSLQVCSLYSFLEFFFFVFYNFSLSNCLEKYLWIWKFMCLTTGCLWFFLFRALCVSGSLCENLKIFLSMFRALCVSGWVQCFFSCFFNCCGS